MASTGTASDLPCHDFAMFQDLMKKMRLLDDRIVNALNTTIPTKSFAGQIDATGRCKQLFKEVLDGQNDRDKAIKTCIQEVSESVDQLRQQRAAKMDDVELLLKLKNEQTRLRMYRGEMHVEEVVNERTNKVFYERCRDYYMPEGFKT